MSCTPSKLMTALFSLDPLLQTMKTINQHWMKFVYPRRFNDLNNDGYAFSRAVLRDVMPSAEQCYMMAMPSAKQCHAGVKFYCLQCIKAITKHI